MYTEETLITRGKYEGQRLCDVPAMYLLNMYKTKGFFDNKIKNYIHKNLEKLEASLNEIELAEYRKVEHCDKMPFATQALAKRELKRIRRQPQEKEKPIRVYECEKCGYWHLSLKPDMRFPDEGDEEEVVFSKNKAFKKFIIKKAPK